MVCVSKRVIEASNVDYLPGKNKSHCCSEDILVSDFDCFVSLTPIIEDVATEN